MVSSVFLYLTLSALHAFAGPLIQRDAPTVTLDGATFTGKTSGTNTQFLGIPFVQPPIGDLRYRLPVSITYGNGTEFDATEFGPTCSQQAIKIPPAIIADGLLTAVPDFLINTFFRQVFPDSEDCLTVNIVKPANATPTDKLPVVVWIFGGGFEIGTSALYDGGRIVDRSLALSQPVVYVSMNYRLNGFGFLAGREVKSAGVGNLGLHDQREALRWIQRYISQFGGDPAKVTIWGESAGAISASLHMLVNGGNTEGLFRGAFMESGAPLPVGDITGGQKYYDALVKDTGCSDAADTLQCLRTAPYATLKNAIDNSPGLLDYQSLNLAWLPRPDGLFLTDNPYKLVAAGKVATVPYITGNCDDEGTLFSLANINVTTDADFESYIQNTFLPGITDAQTAQIATSYPSDITQGSPFDTGILNAVTPQFKRLAAVQGDVFFHAPRRWFLQHTANTRNVWVFLSKRLKSLPVFGALHTTDIINVYTGGEMGDHLIRFANNLNPNPSTGYQWPQFTLTDRNIATYTDDLTTPVVTGTDTYRTEAVDYLNEVTSINLA